MTTKISADDLTKVSFYQDERKRWADLRAQIKATEIAVELNIGGRYYRDSLSADEKDRLSALALDFVHRKIANVDEALVPFGIEVVDD